MSLTVIIPTADRPDYLRTALRSVAAQSSLSEITDILVSENLGNETSRAVCEEFPNLPIHYTLRDPQLGHPRHLGVLAREAQGELIALLNDDDWWSPGHLASGLAAMQQHPDASSWHASTVWTESESTKVGHIYREGILWHAAGCPNSWVDTWLFDAANLIPVCWFYAPFHWTTMVARRNALHEAVRDFETEHAWSADRILPVRLVQHGPVLYSPQPTAFARTHDGNWAAVPEKRRQMEEADSRWIKKLPEIAQSEGIDLASAWLSWIPHLDKVSHHSAGLMFRRHYNEEAIRDLGFPELAREPKPTTYEKIFHTIKQAIPYGIIEKYRKSR